MTTQHQILIQASSEAIFSYLMEVNNRPSYIPALEKVILLDEPPIRNGSRYIEVANIGGRKLETTYQVIEYIENKQITAKTLKSVFPIQATLAVKSAPGATTLMIRLDFQLKGIFRLASPIVMEIVDQQAINILKNVKIEMEK